MSRLKEIFSRQPDKMNRLTKWFFGIPLAYSMYLLISLFIPSFGSSNNAFLIKAAVLELILGLCVLYVVKNILRFKVSKLFCGDDSFCIKLFLSAFCIAFAVFTASSFAMLLINREDFEFTFTSVGFGLNWLCSFILIVFAAVTEELIFRSYIAYYIHDTLEKDNKKIALYSLISGLLFAIFHFSNPEVNGTSAIWTMLFYFIFGFGLMAFSLATGGFEVAFATHIANNLVSSWLFTYDNSVISTDALFTHHNNAGPSLIIQTVICMSIIALFVRFYNNRRTLRH